MADLTLCITDMTSWFFLEPEEAIDLELRLNKTIYGRPWSFIGDHLFNYARKKNVSTSLVVTKDQFSVLLTLVPEEKARTASINT